MADILGSGNGNGNGSPINTPSPKRPRLSPLDPEPKSELVQLPSGSLSVPHAESGCAEKKETEKGKVEEEKEEEEEAEEEEEEAEEEAEEEEEEEEEEKEEEDEEESNSETERTTLTATFTDLKVLDCPNCHKPLCSPVYQCQTGHFACAKCCSNNFRNKSKCYVCNRKTGAIRCLGLEKVLESVTFRCRNKSHGCKEKFKNSKILDHEKACIYTPCACPYDACHYIGMSKSLYKHFGESHKINYCVEFSFDSKKSIPVYYGRRVFLQDRSRSSLFVLKYKPRPEAFVSVVCVAPESTRGAFSYDLTVKLDNDTFINMKAPVECIPKCTDEIMMGKCLLLPKGFEKKSGNIKFELVIRRNPKIAG